MAVITDIADAIVAELNAATFSQPVTAARHYLPQFELPGTASAARDGRPQSAVVLAAARSVAEPGRLQPRRGGSAEVRDAKRTPTSIRCWTWSRRSPTTFGGGGWPAFPDAAWIKTELTVLYAPDHLDELRQFTSVVTLTSASSGKERLR